jgi:beta-ureidopropionase / N-carbamoyl-L-amino-acid hydrolase
VTQPGTGDNLGVDGERLWADLMALAEITDPDRPYTRRSFSPRFLEGRAWLAERFRKAGLTVRVDAACNLIGRWEGAEPGLGTLALGSHSDTVPNGGRFDGTAGVLAALEVVRALRDQGRRPRHSIEVIDCLAEEVSEFGLSCIGSRAMAGMLQPEALSRRKTDGETLFEAITRMGGDPDRLAEARRTDLAAWLELHIEQGQLLERAGDDLGVVTSVVGITRVEIALSGRADHAGTTQMRDRSDALVAASAIVLAVRDRAATQAAEGHGHFVATVGELDINPNAANVVPGAARLLLDIRSERETDIARFLDGLRDEVESVSARFGVRVERMEVLSQAGPVLFDGHLLHCLETQAERLELSHRRMVSGAGHDAAFLSRIAPAAMVFIPSLNGRSHCPEEWSDKRHLVGGTAVLLDTITQLDKAGKGTSDALQRS